MLNILKLLRMLRIRLIYYIKIKLMLEKSRLNYKMKDIRDLLSELHHVFKIKDKKQINAKLLRIVMSEILMSNSSITIL